MNQLGVYHLREHGPILLFRLLKDTKLINIKDACCKYWVYFLFEIKNINSVTYNLYDDSFNNLETCKEEVGLTEFFEHYEPTDKTLKEGEITFYLIEKLKIQKCILDSQQQSILKKS